MSENRPCFWCGGPLDAFAEVIFNAEVTAICKCPTEGEYVMLPSLMAVISHVRPEERATVQARLSDFAAIADEGDRLEISRLFVEGITGRSLAEP